VSKQPPKHLDPYVLIRDPDSLPRLVRMGIVDLLRRELGGNDPGHDDMVKAFNVICWSLLTAGPQRNGAKRRIRVSPNNKSTVVLTNLGEMIERERVKKPKKTKAKKPAAKTVLPWIPFPKKAAMLKRWAKTIYEQDPAKYSQSWWEANTNSA